MNTSKRLYPTASGGGAAVVPERMAKIRETAERYNLPEEYVRLLVETRRVASVKLGKYRLVDLDSLDALLARGYTPAEEVGA